MINCLLTEAAPTQNVLSPTPKRKRLQKERRRKNEKNSKKSLRLATDQQHVYFKQKDLFKFLFKNSVSLVRIRVYHTPNGRRFLNSAWQKSWGSVEIDHSTVLQYLHVYPREKLT